LFRANSAPSLEIFSRKRCGKPEINASKFRKNIEISDYQLTDIFLKLPFPIMSHLHAHRVTPLHGNH